MDIFTPAVDVEASFLTYHYLWFRDGDLVADLTGDSVPGDRTTRGQNWSVGQTLRGRQGEGSGGGE